MEWGLRLDDVTGGKLYSRLSDGYTGSIVAINFPETQELKSIC
jgi:hypothetical protein